MAKLFLMVAREAGDILLNLIALSLLLWFFAAIGTIVAALKIGAIYGF